MNYRHAYHAGNFADVIKHLILIDLLHLLQRKNTPFCYIDTHAGRGYYDLQSEQASKTNEYTHGIEKIIQQPSPPVLVQRYLDCIHKINNQLTHSHYASLRYYPGSPLIAKQVIRPQDRIIACELQPDEYQALKNTFIGDKQTAIHHTDGFLGLKAFLPPKERRGLILIDPPYEDSNEFVRLAQTLPAALKRFETGIYAIWYPLKDKKLTDQFYQSLKKAISQPILAVELTIYPDLPNHLNGSGMVIINPPWHFNDNLTSLLPWLWKALTINQQGGYRSFVLN